MSITPRTQRLPPPRSKQADAALLLLKKPATSNSALLKRDPVHSSFPLHRKEALARPPACSLGGEGSESPSKAKAGSESSFKVRGGGPGPGAPGVAAGRGSVGLLAPIRRSIREMGLLQFSRSNKNKYDGRGIILPESEANIEVDKLLAQWADKINKAEKEFEEEELAFERARVRLCTSNNRGTLRALSPSPAARLVEKAKRIVSQSEILAPITARHSTSNTNQHNNHSMNKTRTDTSEKPRHEISRDL